MKTYDGHQLRGAFAAGFSAAHGVEYPKGDTKRRKALVALKTNPLIQEAIKVEPRLAPLLEAAKQQKNEDGYHRIRRYYELKRQAEVLVGWYSRHKQIKTTQHFEAIVNTIGDLLPADDVDLYPEGKPD